MTLRLRGRFSDYIGMASLITIVTGIFFSRAAISIGMVGVVFYSVFLSDLKHNLRVFFRDRVSVGLALIFLIFLVSGLNSTNHAYWLDRVSSKIPFLLLPFAFCAYRPILSRQNFNLILVIYLLVATISSLHVTWIYASEYSDVNNAYSRGGVMMTPFNHLRYSILISFSIFIASYLYVERGVFRQRWQRIGLLVIIGYLTLFLHLLAVRTGLIAFYIGAGFMVYHFALAKKKIMLGVSLLTGLVALPVILFFLLPSMQGRLNYVQYDLNQYLEENNAQHLSDASRIISLQSGLEITRQNWLFGIGIGDLQDAMKQRMQQSSAQPQELMLPLCEFIVLSAGCGIFGFLIFTFAVFQPFFDVKNRRHWLTVVFLIFFIFSVITDAALEEQIGVAFYLIFLLLFHSYNHRDASFGSDHRK